MTYFQDFPQTHIFNIMSGLAEKNVPSPNYIKLFLMLNISHLVYSHYFKFFFNFITSYKRDMKIRKTGSASSDRFLVCF